MSTLDDIIKQTKALMKNTVAVPADNTRYGELPGVEAKAISKIALDIAAKKAKKAYRGLTTNGPDSLFPDPKKYPKEAEEAAINFVIGSGGGLNRIGPKVLPAGTVNVFTKGMTEAAPNVFRKTNALIQKKEIPWDKATKGSVISRIEHLANKTPKVVRNMKDYVDIAKGLQPVRETFAVADIVNGMKKRGEKFIGTINAYPEIPTGSKFVENIGTGGQTEGPGFYSATLGSDTPSYYAYWNQRDNKSNVFGENIILSNGNFGIGNSDRAATTLVIEKLLKAVGEKVPHRISLVENLYDVAARNGAQRDLSSPYRMTLPASTSKRRGKTATDYIRRWVDFAGAAEAANFGGRFSEANSMLNDFYNNSKMFSKFVDSKIALRRKYYFDGKNLKVYSKTLTEPHTGIYGTVTITRPVNLHNGPSEISDGLRGIYSKILKMEKQRHKRAYSSLKKAFQLEQELPEIENTSANAVYASGYDNINYVTSPKNTFPIARAGGMLDSNTFENTTILNAGSAYREKLFNLIRGDGRYPVAYDITKDNAAAKIAGESGYEHVLSRDIVSKIKKTDRYVTGKEGVMHAINKLLEKYGE